jgi:uncharacterized protein (TIGR03086 family)
MTEARAATTLFGGVALLERAVSYTLGQLGLVNLASLARPTPCGDWDLRALLGHMNDSLVALQEALDLRHVDLDPGLGASLGPGNGPGRGPGSGDLAADLVGGLRGRACRLLGALAGTHDVPVSIGGCSLPTSIVSSAGAIDVAVHGWDVARACGGGEPIPEQLAEDMLAIAPYLVTSEDRPARFAVPIPVSSRASASDRLIAYLGRSPG